MYSLLVRRLTLFTLSHIFVSHFVSLKCIPRVSAAFLAQSQGGIPSSKEPVFEIIRGDGSCYDVLDRSSSSPTESNTSIQVSSQWNSVYGCTGTWMPIRIHL